MILFFGGALGLVSLLLAAFLHHNSAAIAPIENFNAIKIAVNYTQINAVLISVLGLFILWPRLKAAKRLLYWISVLLAFRHVFILSWGSRIELFPYPYFICVRSRRWTVYDFFMVFIDGVGITV